MKDIIINEKESVVLACIMKDINNVYYCVYHEDDGDNKIIFTSNIDKLSSLEDFSNYNIGKITNHLNTYGFEIEPKNIFDEVLYFKKLPDNLSIELIKVKIKEYLKCEFL